MLLYGWIIIGLSLKTISASFLDIDELKDVQYSIQILDTPVAFRDKTLTEPEENSEEAEKSSSPTPKGGSVVAMLNKFGQKYHCILPSPVEEEKLDDTDENEYEGPDEINSLLEPLYTKPCIIKTKDWWTYEICVGRSVKQYHMENDKPVGVILNLGEFDTNKKDERSNLTFHPQWYSNGTRCDLTGSLRQTEVRFVCSEAVPTEIVVDIFEPQSCEYTILIYTNRVCKVPHLRPPKEPEPLEINCHPVLTAEQLAQYERYAEMKTKKAELKLKKIKENQKSLESLFNEKYGTFRNLFGSEVADTLQKEIFSFLDGKTELDSPAIKIIDMQDLMKKAKKPEDDDTFLVKLPDDTIDNDDELDSVIPLSDQSGTEGIDQSASIAEEKQFFKSSEEGGLQKDSSSSKDSWQILNRKKNRITSPELDRLKEERNEVWKKIADNKKLVKTFSAQLQDTKTFIKDNLENEVKYDAGIIEKLEEQKQQLELILDKTRESVSSQELEAKDLSHQILKLQYKLQKEQESEDEKKETSADHSDDQSDDLQLDAMKKELNARIKALDPKLMDEVQELLKSELARQLPDFISEAVEELNMQESDIQGEGALDGVEDELTDLMSQLGGAEHDVQTVQRQLDALREQVMSTDSLKRDGKLSVKKELRDEDYPSQEEQKARQASMLDSKEMIRDSKERLNKLEKELDKMEQRLKENRQKIDLGKKQVNQDLDADESENALKDKMEASGVQKPMEIRVITTRLPLSYGEATGEEGEEDEFISQMVHNLMVGDHRGYEDIDNQRKTEKSYKFTWSESMMEKMEDELAQLQTDDTLDVDLSEESDYNAEELDLQDSSLQNVLFGAGEQRRRPSSLLTSVHIEADIEDTGEHDANIDAEDNIAERDEL